MAVIDELAVLITARTGQFTKGMNEAAGRVTAFSKSASQLGKNIDRTPNTIESVGLRLRNFTVRIGAAVTVFNALRFGKQAADDLSRIIDLADTLGTSAATVQRLEFIGTKAGIGIDEFAKSIEFNNKVLGQALDGSKEARAEFERLGLSAEKLAGSSLEDRLKAQAEAFRRLPTQAQRAAAAVGLFSRSGQQLLRVFKEGSEGITKLISAAEDFGLITQKDAEAVELLGDATDLLVLSLKNLARSLVAEIATPLTDFFDNLRGGLAGIKELLSGKTLGEVTRAIPENKAIADFERLAARIGEAQGNFEKLAPAIVEAAREAKQFDLALNVERQSQLIRGLTDEFGKLGETIKNTTGEQIRNNEAQQRAVEAEIARRAQTIVDIKENEKTLARFLKKAGLPPVFFDFLTGEEFERQSRAIEQMKRLQKERADLEAKFATQSANAGKIAEQIQKRAAAIKDFQEAQKLGAKITEQNRTPLEKFNDEARAAEKAFRLGAISAKDFARELFRLNEELAKQTGKFAPGPEFGSHEAQKILEGSAGMQDRWAKVVAQVQRQIELDQIVEALNERFIAQGARRLEIEQKITKELESQAKQRVPTRSQEQEAARRAKEIDAVRNQRVPTREEVQRELELQRDILDDIIRERPGGAQSNQRVIERNEPPAPKLPEIQRVPTREEMQRAREGNGAALQEISDGIRELIVEIKGLRKTEEDAFKAQKDNSLAAFDLSTPPAP